MKKISNINSQSKKNTSSILRFVPCSIETCTGCYVRCPQSGPLSSVNSSRDASQGGKVSVE